VPETIVQLENEAIGLLPKMHRYLTTLPYLDIIMFSLTEGCRRLAVVWATLTEYWIAYLTAERQALWPCKCRQPIYVGEMQQIEGQMQPTKVKVGQMRLCHLPRNT